MAGDLMVFTPDQKAGHKGIARTNTIHQIISFMDRHFKHYAASLRDNPISAFGKQSERGLAITDTSLKPFYQRGGGIEPVQVFITKFQNMGMLHHTFDTRTVAIRIRNQRRKAGYWGQGWSMQRRHHAQLGDV